MADPIVNFFKSTLVGTYSNTDTSITIATGDGALLPDPSTDGAFNLTIFEGLQVTNSTSFEIVRVTARSGDVLTVTRGAESTTPLTIGSATHSILMSATKKTFDDIRSDIANIDLTTISGAESITFDTTGDEVLRFPIGTTAQRPLSPQTGYIRYNSDKESIEFYNGTNWLRLQSVEFNSLALGVATATVSGQDATLLTNAILNAERLTFNSSGDESFTLPSGTEAQRPTGVAGRMRYNTDEDTVEVYLTDWLKLDTSEYYVAGGSSFGYSAGGGGINVIEKYSFTSDANATDVADLSSNQHIAGGASSSTHGYVSGGIITFFNPINVIEKYPFATSTNATDVGDITVARGFTTGFFSSTHGYTAGGDVGGGSYRNIIDKYTFSSDSNATDVGDMTAARYGPHGAQSQTHGYISGGNGPSAQDTNNRTEIDKVSLSSDGNATDVGDLTVGRRTGSSASSETHGYTCGGVGPAGGNTRQNVIDKFSFASDGNATDVGDLLSVINALAGASSTSHGYASGGYDQNISSVINVIQKFSFESDGNATDVADLTASKSNATGAQV